MKMAYVYLAYTFFIVGQVLTALSFVILAIGIFATGAWHE